MTGEKPHPGAPGWGPRRAGLWGWAGSQAWRGLVEQEGIWRRSEVIAPLRVVQVSGHNPRVRNTTGWNRSMCFLLVERARPMPPYQSYACGAVELSLGCMDVVNAAARGGVPANGAARDLHREAVEKSVLCSRASYCGFVSSTGDELSVFGGKSQQCSGTLRAVSRK